VDEAGEFDTGDVAGAAIDAFEVPDGFCGFWVDLCYVSDPAARLHWRARTSSRKPPPLVLSKMPVKPQR
jgi:hypothetical protein